MTHRYKNRPQDEQPGQSGKAENDTNKQGDQHPTQTNQGRRTVRSRHDREAQVGGENQHKVRGGSPQSDGSVFTAQHGKGLKP